MTITDRQTPLGPILADGDDSRHSASLNNSADVLSPEEAKATIRKIDRRLIPIVAVMYCFSVIGRANLPSASIAGMHEDLDLSGNRYVRPPFPLMPFDTDRRIQSVVLLVFFPTYIFCQPVAAVLARKIGPRVFFTGITLSTGLIVLGMGFMRTWVDLLVVRLLMGAVVSGFFASCVYLLSTWYTRGMAARCRAEICMVLTELFQWRSGSGFPSSISSSACHMPSAVSCLLE